MFAKVAAFELRYQLRQPLFWIVTAIFFLMAFGITASNVIRIGGVGEVHRNSPSMLSMLHLITGLFFMFVTTAFVAGAVLKDDDTGFGPIVRTTRLNKFDYLYGRFCGAFAAACIAYLSVTFAALLGGFAPWLDPELVGPFRPVDYLYAYGILGLPALFLTASLFFAVATVTRSMGWTFVGVIAFVIGYIVVNIVLGKPEYEAAVARWEPFGIGAYQYVTRYWTVADSNSLNPPLTGLLLFNRLFALGLGAVFLALAYPLYRLRAAPAGQRQRPERA
ncbi:MAG TPA: aminopeptidase, partial [Caulobacteraceae bacterium]|nr:aminopeptidase [Caulobacteraceae bacterium]